MAETKCRHTAASLNPVLFTSTNMQKKITFKMYGQCYFHGNVDVTCSNSSQLVFVMTCSQRTMPLKVVASRFCLGYFERFMSRSQYCS